MSADNDRVSGLPLDKTDHTIDIEQDDRKNEIDAEDQFPPEGWFERLKAEYTGQHGGETLPAGCDPDRMVAAILTLNEDESVQVLEDLLVSQREDYTIDRQMMARLRELIRGNKACDMEQGEWAYEVCKRAGLCHNWSPYAEVRAVTLPYDDADEACESFRAYVLGYFWVCVCTAVNTCKLSSYLRIPRPRTFIV